MSLMQGNQGQTGKQLGQNLTAGFGEFSDVMVTELMPRYYEQTYRGNTYTLSVVTAAAITAFVGAAGGTPQLAVYNPVGSGKNLVILQASYANAVAASAAGTVQWGLYYGATAAITQATLTAPTNLVTQSATGSVAKGFSAVALTSSTVAANVLPLGWYYWATAAGALAVAPVMVDVAGSIIIPPGSYAALGGSSALTSATWQSALMWDEVAI